MTEKVLQQYRVLYGLVSKSIPGTHLISMRKAFLMVVKAYQKKQCETILTQESSMVHAIEVAYIVAKKFDAGLDIIIGALLHDIMLETQVSKKSIQQELGTTIAKIVLEITGLAQVAKSGYSALLGNIKHMLSSFSLNSLNVLVIKIAECLHNMRTIYKLSVSRRGQVINEIRHIYLPLLSVLGLDHIQSELEDLYFQFIDNPKYYYLVSKVKASCLTEEKFLEKFVSPIQASLHREGWKYKILGRTKSIASIHNKICQRHICFEEICDLYGIRIVFENMDDNEHDYCWRIYNIVTNLYYPRSDRVRNWLKQPRASGYEALHVTVIGPEKQWVEVQIRSKRMDHEAKYGVAVHWEYKDQDLRPWLNGIDKNWLGSGEVFIKSHWKYRQKSITIISSSVYTRQAHNKIG